MYATLMGEPLLLRPVEIAALTDRQIVDLYFHPRDRQGRIVAHAEEVETAELTKEQAAEQLRQMMAMFGVDPAGKEKAFDERDPAGTA